MKWLLLLLAACGDNKFSSLPYFEWTDQQTIGAFNIDHIAADDPGLLDAVDQAANYEVVMFYGHDPPNGTQYATIEALAPATGLLFGSLLWCVKAELL